MEARARRADHRQARQRLVLRNRPRTDAAHARHRQSCAERHHHRRLCSYDDARSQRPWLRMPVARRLLRSDRSWQSPRRDQDGQDAGRRLWRGEQFSRLHRGLAMTRCAFVHRISTRGPDDTVTLDAMLASGAIEAEGLVAILGKTEGNGCVNDFSRGFASVSLKETLRRHLPKEKADAVCIVMSGGTEGALSPHIVVLEARETEAAPEFGALALGSARTSVLPFEHLGRVEQVDLVAAGVKAAMADAGLTSAADVHFVQIKCPLLTLERVAETEARGLTIATRHAL